MKPQVRVNKNASRRNLLKMAGGCAALTNTSLLSTIFNLSATNTVVAQGGGFTDYKALVCVFLFGGNDSYNMLTPATDADPDGGGPLLSERGYYLAARGGLHTDGDGALGLPLDPAQVITDSASGRQFMIHPAMTGVKSLFDSGKATFLANVGSLIHPDTTLADVDANTNVPLGLYSHSDLQQHWMTTVPQSRSQVNGWAGRMADLITDGSNLNASGVSMNIAINNVNMMQTGKKVVPYIIRDNGAIEVNWYGETWTQAGIYTDLTDSVLSRSYGNLLEKTFAGMNRNALDAAIDFNLATNAVTSVDGFFPPDNPPAPTVGSTDFDRQMRRIAKAIGAHGTPGVVTPGSLNQSRQIFFVGVGGWDNHDELINNQEGNLGKVSAGLKSFQDAIDDLGLTNNVVTFTASDFARTLNSNGGGSDHGWGGNQIIMGGPIAGGRIHGEYPMNLLNPEAVDGRDLHDGRGRMIPTTSVDEMAAELAMWYGIGNNADLETILPNIRNFDSANSGSHPIGILT